MLGGEVQRYSRSGLADHLTQAGFTVRRLTYTNFAILPIVAAVRFLQRLRQGRHEESDSEMTVRRRPSTRRSPACWPSNRPRSAW